MLCYQDSRILQVLVKMMHTNIDNVGKTVIILCLVMLSWSIMIHIYVVIKTFV